MESFGEEAISESTFFNKKYGRHQVFAAVEIIQVSSIDTVDQSFDCRFSVTLSWMGTEKDFKNHKENHHAFKPIWSPGFPTLPTLVKKEEAKEENATATMMRGMFVIHQQYIIDGTFSEVFELEHYPFDSQEFSIKMMWCKHDMTLHPAMAKEFLKFDATAMAIGEWYFTGPMVEFKYKKEKITDKDLKLQSVQYPTLSISLRALRVYKTTVINIYIILALITLSSMGAFCLAVEDGGSRLSHASTVLLSTIAFLYIVQASLPKLTYMTITDYFVFTGTVFVCFITIEISIIAFLMSHTDTEFSTHADDIIIITNLGLWLLYVGGFSCNIIFRIIPKELKKNAAPGQDTCRTKDRAIDFSMGSFVAFTPKEKVRQYFWEMNRDDDFIMHTMWKSNDYGQYFKAFFEISENDKQTKKFICLKLLKITGDKHVPAGYISMKTQMLPFYSIIDSKAFKEAQFQVRNDENDTKGFYFKNPMPFKAEREMMKCDGICWHALKDDDKKLKDDDENSEESDKEFNHYDFNFDNSDSETSADEETVKESKEELKTFFTHKYNQKSSGEC